MNKRFEISHIIGHTVLIILFFILGLKGSKYWWIASVTLLIGTIILLIRLMNSEKKSVKKVI